MTNLSLTYSYGWVIICLFIGIGYAWVQYAKSAPWSKKLNYVLASFRILLVSVICFLLLEPHIRTLTNYYEKPVMVVAIDNSESIAISHSADELAAIKSDIAELNGLLVQKGYDVPMVDLTGSTIEQIDSLSFTSSLSNLSSQLLKVKNDYKDYNLAGVVVLTDGIFNEGYSPLAISNLIPVYSIGLGDTTEIKDLAIQEVRHNSTVYQGNSLQLEVHLINNGMGDCMSDLNVVQEGTVVASKRVSFKKGQVLNKVIFSIPIDGNGKQSLTVNLSKVKGEYTALNNRSTIYFDIVDARKRILLLASAPHPDLKAIKSSIEQNEYYEVELAYELPKTLDYELIILHQYPSVSSKQSDREQLLSIKIPKWIIVGSLSDLRYLKNDLKVISSYGSIGRQDVVKPLWNNDFKAFSLNEGFVEWISEVPPLAMPYGLSFEQLGNTVMFNRQIGNVATQDPMFLFSRQNENPVGVLSGTGIWKWKMDEYRREQVHKNFEDFISKTVQYLSSDATRKRFYVFPLKTKYELGEEVVFNTEEYNALFEQVTGYKVNLVLTDRRGQKRNYSYIPLNGNSSYKVSNLPEGIYSYYASTTMDTIKYSASGQFVIRKLNKEALNPVADHDLLKKLSAKTSGIFYPFTQVEEFMNDIENFNPVSTIHSSEKSVPFNTIKWVLILLFILVFTEWFLRKYYGGY